MFFNCLFFWLLFLFYLLLYRRIILFRRISWLLDFGRLILLFLFGRSRRRLLMRVSFFIRVFYLCVIWHSLYFWLFCRLLLCRSFLLIFGFVAISCWGLRWMIIGNWFRFFSIFSCLGLWLICMLIFFSYLWGRAFLMSLLELIQLFKELGRRNLNAISLLHHIL